MAKPPQTAAKPTRRDETRKISDLKPDPKNARRHSESQIAQIAQSMEDFGVVHRILIRPSGQIIGGHASIEALKRLGRQDADVSVIDGLTEAGYRKLGLALNKLPEDSRWDNDVLRELFAEFDANDEDMGGTGFGAKEIEKLLAQDDDIEVREIETGPVEDEFWISIRGPLAQQANALKALDAAMKPFAGVTVEQGTINLG